MMQISRSQTVRNTKRLNSMLNIWKQLHVACSIPINMNEEYVSILHTSLVVKV